MGHTCSMAPSAWTQLPPITVASFATAGIMYPADLVRALRMGAPTRPITSLVREFRATYGWSGFFTQGVGPEVARAGIMRTLKFFNFPVFFEAIHGKPVSAGTGAEKATVAVVAALPETFVILPFEMGKVGLQLDKANEFKGSATNAMRRVVKDRGLARGLFSGYVGVRRLHRNKLLIGDLHANSKHPQYLIPSDPFLSIASPGRRPVAPEQLVVPLLFDGRFLRSRAPVRRPRRRAEGEPRPVARQARGSSPASSSIAIPSSASHHSRPGSPRAARARS